MAVDKIEILKAANCLGYRSSKMEPNKIVEWLREEMQIHLKVGAIWDK